MSMFENILDEMREIHEAKNNDYSPEGEFGNFSESERVGVEAWKGAFIRLQDKYTRACNLIRGKDQMVKNETLSDTLLDLANYAVIVLCLRRNIVQKQEIENVNETDLVEPVPQHTWFGEEKFITQKEKCRHWREGQGVKFTHAGDEDNDR